MTSNEVPPIVSDGTATTASNPPQQPLESFTPQLAEFEEVLIEYLKTRPNSQTHKTMIDIGNLNAFSADLFDHLAHHPVETYKTLQTAIQRIEAEEASSLRDGAKVDISTIAKPKIMLTWPQQQPLSIGQLGSEHIGKMVKIQGIVIKKSKKFSRVRKLVAYCRKCGFSFQEINDVNPFGKLSLPFKCVATQNAETVAACPPNPFVIDRGQTQSRDQQILKVQELPENVPTGEVGRTLVVLLEDHFVETLRAGERANFCGVLETISPTQTAKSASSEKSRSSNPSLGICSSFFRVLGVEEKKYGWEGNGNEISFTNEEISEFRSFSKRKDVHDFISQSIAPAIYGHPFIKEAIAVQLFGGMSRIMPTDDIRIRGDIHILLLGDPSTAKSQLLKYVQKVAPICVYTSGKGSSAAGLTASVMKEAGSNGFYLEAGSLVLANGGIVCIDEFDKMDSKDQVAIHEAMEQQTISISKAGINTQLMARTSVLAAANPRFGTYVDSEGIEDQINMQAALLSRFDLIFFVKDVKSAILDEKIAKHVLEIHKQGKFTKNKGTLANGTDDELDNDFLKKYICYSREKCNPILSGPAKDKLLAFYKTQRQDTHLSKFRIVVRHLEALIRISEGFAKMELSNIVTPEHADKAINLFNKSRENSK